MKMSFQLEHKGGQYYYSADYSTKEGKAVSLTKTRLGEFCHGVLMHGGEIIQLWPFNRSQGSLVLVIVAMKPEDKETFEKECGFKLNDPPEIHLN